MTAPTADERAELDVRVERWEAAIHDYENRALAAEAKVAAVEALLVSWERQHTHLGIERGNWGPPSSSLRAALD